MSVARAIIWLCTSRPRLTWLFTYHVLAFSTEKTLESAAYPWPRSGTGVAAADGPGAERGRQCPRCHGRSMDEPAYAYLLGLYLGDGSITRGRRDVFALWIACCDDWPGLLAACRSAMSDVMPASSVFCVHYQGCTAVKSTSKHWPCLFPQHGPGRKHTRKIELEQWQSAIVGQYPGEFARGLFHSDGWRGVNRVRRRLTDGDRWYEYPRYQFSNECG